MKNWIAKYKNLSGFTKFIYACALVPMILGSLSFSTFMFFRLVFPGIYAPVSAAMYGGIIAIFLGLALIVIALLTMVLGRAKMSKDVFSKFIGLTIVNFVLVFLYIYCVIGIVKFTKRYPPSVHVQNCLNKDVLIAYSADGFREEKTIEADGYSNQYFEAKNYERIELLFDGQRYEIFENTNKRIYTKINLIITPKGQLASHNVYSLDCLELGQNIKIMESMK